MDDLTVIFYTANLVDGLMMEFTTRTLKQAVGDSQIISVSHDPMDFGLNICVGQRRQHVWNIYDQLLTGAMTATTKYVAAAEDDILYSYEHFHTMLPAPGTFLYDTNRWLLFTWKDPIYSYKGRIITGMMLAERDLLIEALEERLNKYPSPESVDPNVFGEVGRNEKELGVTVRKEKRFRADVPCVMFNHERSVTYQALGRRKSSGITPTRWLPHWGRSEWLMEVLNGTSSPD